MQNTEVFPSMVLQMVAIGEESGALDSMLGKVADFYEPRWTMPWKRFSSLMEPIIMVVLGTLIGGMVIAMYLPISRWGKLFKLRVAFSHNPARPLWPRFLMNNAL